MKIFLSSLLHTIYGIHLKWEERVDGKVVLGEGCLSNMGDSLSLHRKGATLVLDPLCDFEWNKWVNGFSPHARLVWRSHFPSLLPKSLRCALHYFDLLANLCSLMWGVGYKAYPRRWWLPIIKRSYRQQGRNRLVALMGLKTWVNDGGKRAIELKVEWAGSDLELSNVGSGGARLH